MAALRAACPQGLDVYFEKVGGVILVAAAGNESGPVSYPAKYPGVIAVSAINNLRVFGYFSNFGPEIAFTAPGVGIRSTVPNDSYTNFFGTSMASPHVAGVAALMVASGRTQLLGDDIGLPAEQQGQGLINALSTVSQQ